MFAIYKHADYLQVVEVELYEDHSRRYWMESENRYEIDETRFLCPPMATKQQAEQIVNGVMVWLGERFIRVN
jgi:hypothetical protein